MTGPTAFGGTGPNDDDDDDGGSTTAPPTGGTGPLPGTDGPATEDPPPTTTTTDPSTSSTAADPTTTTDATTDPTTASTTESATTDVCTPGTVGCPCDAGACDGGLVCTDGVCLSPSCGDGKVDPGEACDAGAGNGPGKACLDTCVLNTCGDGDKGPGEGCDDGADNGDDSACLDTCEPATCGDGELWDGQEQCDDGAQNGNTKPCLSTCKTNVCGDGFVLADVEECDDGAQNGNTKACLADCEQNVCGDGFIEAGVEACDDANLDFNDGCTPNCKLETDEVVTVSGLNAPIVDDAYTGSQESMTCVGLDALTPLVITNIKVTLAIDHDAIGDLTIKLYSPNDDVLTLLSRPGLAEVGDNGSGVSNEVDNLSAAYPIRFRDGGSKNAETMGSSLPNNAGVVCKDDGFCDYAPNKGSATGLANFAGFDGTASQGTWTLCVADSTWAFAGFLQEVKLEINIP